MKAIEIREASFCYRGSREPALKDINLDVEEGEFVLVTGPSGSGKSTLIRLINGLIPHFHEGTLAGTVKVMERETLNLRPNQIATVVGSVFQFPEEQIVASKVWRDVAFGPENLLLEREEIYRRVDEALAFVGLEHLRDREVFSLSGGEKQRLAIAGILAMKPEILLLDEPAAELDPVGRRTVLSLVVHLSRQEGRTILLADHRLEDLVGFVDRVVVMHGGAVGMDGRPEEIMSRHELAELGVEIPRAIQVWRRLQDLGIQPLAWPPTTEKVGEAIRSLGRKGAEGRGVIS